MIMNILLYGRLSERVGRQIMIDVPDRGCAVAELRQLIADQHPPLRDEIFRQRVRACVDDEIVSEDARVVRDQTVEFLPPVSGG
jgi:molybdopterin converting factor small subunit